MANSEFNVAGLAELKKMLEELPAKVEGSVMRGALRAGSRVIADVAKANVPNDQGHLKKSIRVTTSNRKGEVKARVIAGNAKAYYAHMIEFGTGSYYSGTETKSKRAPYEIKPRNRLSLLIAGALKEFVVHPGIKPNPFMRNAADQGTPAAIDAVVLYLRERIPKEVLKL